MKYAIKKNGKYMTGHGYGSGVGYRFSWSKSVNDARLWDAKEDIEGLRQLSKGRVVEVPE